MKKQKLVHEIKKIKAMCMAPLGNNKVVELISKEDVIKLVGG